MVSSQAGMWRVCYRWSWFLIWEVRGEFGSEAALVRVTRGGGGGTWRSGDDDLCNTAEVREATGAESLTEVW